VFLGFRKFVFPFHSTAYVNAALEDEEKSSPDILLIALTKTISGFFMSQINHPTYHTEGSS
jgi:hypothetical protein